MSKSNRLVYLWCVLIGGIVFVAILPADGMIYQFVAVFDSNRWCHFLAYTAAVAIPFVVWKLRWSFLLFLIPPTVGIVIESFQSYIPGAVVRGQNVPADLFGVAAGILLGLNLRLMRNAERPLESVSASRPVRGIF